MRSDDGAAETDRARVFVDWIAGSQDRLSIDAYAPSFVVDRRIWCKAMGTTSSQVDTRRGHQYDHDTQRQLLHAEFLRLPSGPSDG